MHILAGTNGDANTIFDLIRRRKRTTNHSLAFARVQLCLTRILQRRPAILMTGPPGDRKRQVTRKSSFAVPTLDVVLGSASAKKRPGAHVVGRPFTNYLSLPPDKAVVDAKKYPGLRPYKAAVDAVAYQFAKNDDTATKRFKALAFRKAVWSAHCAGCRKIAEYNAQDRPAHATAALRAFGALSIIRFLNAVKRAAKGDELPHQD